MTHVTIKVYHSNNAAGDRSRTLVETRRVETGSEKQLTAKRAKKLIAREYPSYAGGYLGPSLIRIQNGWQATRSLEPSEACSYHFIWEELEIYEE